MLMRFGNGQGWHNATQSEIEEMKKNGWEESSEEERTKFIAAKNQPIVEKSVTIEPQREAKGKPGRKPKNKVAGGVYGDDSDQG